jgi:hypothetical protein
LIWRRMIPKIHLAQQFGKDLVKHLCISIFEIMIWEEWKAKFRKFRKPHIFSQQFSWRRFWCSFTWIRKIFGAEKLRDSPGLIFPFCDEIF